MDKITYASLGSLGEDFHRTFDAALKQARERLGRAHPMYIESTLKTTLLAESRENAQDSSGTQSRVSKRECGEAAGAVATCW